MDVALNMPQTKMNLGSMPAMTATLNTEASDVMHAIILPVIWPPIISGIIHIMSRKEGEGVRQSVMLGHKA